MALPTAGFSQILTPSERTREKLMVVVRESRGANRPDDTLLPTGKTKVKLADGKEVEVALAHWQYIGDTHIRFVFDGPLMMQNATMEDLEHLNIKTVEEALAVALVNIKRVYGEPSTKALGGGILQLQGKSPGLDSWYFLDRALWQRLAQAHPDGLVAAVPKRGSLLYAPATDVSAVRVMNAVVAQVHAANDKMHVSSALYLFKDGKWSVLRAGPQES